VRIDLHTHSAASDGTDPPAEVMAKARLAGLDVIALTDHDTVGGHADAAAALPPGLTLVPGAEISCTVGGISIHLLAYLFDPADTALARELELLRTDRVRRAEAIVANCVALGATISWSRVRGIAGDAAVGRPHIATALVEAGVVPDVSAAFTPDWISDDGRAYVDKYALEPDRALALVRAAGGVMVFAHPGAHKRGRTVDDGVIAKLAAAGLAGIEVDHVDHDEATRRRLRALADDLGLLVTGSSDYHGTRKQVRLGAYTTAVEMYEALVAQATGAQPVTGAAVREVGRRGDGTGRVTGGEAR
jgi:3',5'-nucleoside bisphosphate phosphatase